MNLFKKLGREQKTDSEEFCKEEKDLYLSPIDRVHMGEVMETSKESINGVNRELLLLHTNYRSKIRFLTPPNYWITDTFTESAWPIDQEHTFLYCYSKNFRGIGEKYLGRCEEVSLTYSILGNNSNLMYLVNASSLGSVLYVDSILYSSDYKKNNVCTFRRDIVGAKTHHPIREGIDFENLMENIDTLLNNTRIYQTHLKSRFSGFIENTSNVDAINFNGESHNIIL